MKFNCAACQAKYQIADEKVAGKTVRMKCRKCGGSIQVRAEIGPDGAVTAVLVPPGASERPPAPTAPAAAAPAPAAPPAPPRAHLPGGATAPARPSPLAGAAAPPAAGQVAAGPRPGAPPAGPGLPRPGPPSPLGPPRPWAPTGPPLAGRAVPLPPTGAAPGAPGAACAPAAGPSPLGPPPRPGAPPPGPAPFVPRPPPRPPGPPRPLVSPAPPPAAAPAPRAPVAVAEPAGLGLAPLGEEPSADEATQVMKRKAPVEALAALGIFPGRPEPEVSAALPRAATGVPPAPVPAPPAAPVEAMPSPRGFAPAGEVPPPNLAALGLPLVPVLETAVPAPEAAPAAPPIEAPAPAGAASADEPSIEFAPLGPAESGEGSFPSLPKLPSAPGPMRASSPGSLAVQGDLHQEWFVGIDNEPVGPVGVSFLRHHLATGKVGADSLVWRDGMADWQPMKSVLELDPIVRLHALGLILGPSPELHDDRAVAAEGGSAPTPVHVPPASVSDPLALMRVKEEDRPPAAPAAGPAADVAVAAGELPAEPPAAREEAVRPPVAEAHVEGRAVAAPKAEAAEIPPTERRPSERPDAHAARAADARLDEELAELGELKPRHRERRRRRRGMSPLAYAFIAMAGGFGGTAAYVLLTNPVPAAPTVNTVYKYIERPAGTGPAGTAGPAAESSAGAAAGPSGRLPGPLPAAGADAAASASAEASASAGKPADPLDPELAGMLEGGGEGPPSKGSAGEQASRAGGLTTEQIGAVVGANKPVVSGGCWQPALKNRLGIGPASARVVASLVVSASGKVSSASASGSEAEFPGLSSCIAKKVRNWKFPPSGGETPVNVPFVFVAQ
ncbi:MAG: zinc-ribbon domain-containing protein [Deltaproteobacteria bacterium]|nr:zinc-ribbon domain-containing protein [Deltaproteobacteria bacterium]